MHFGPGNVTGWDTEGVKTGSKQRLQPNEDGRQHGTENMAGV